MAIRKSVLPLPAAFAALLLQPALAQPQPAKVQPPLTTRFPNGVTATWDLVYSAIDGFRPLQLDVYTPPPTGAPKPNVLYVHGGGWRNGDQRHGGTFEDFPAVLAGVAARGYVVTSISYRLSGESRFPAAIHDTKNAIRWMRQHAAEFHMDPSRTVIWGPSAGGQIASLVGTSCGVAALEPPPPQPAGPAGAAPPPAAPLPSDCVQGVIDWYGVTDLLHVASDAGRKAAAAPAATPLSTVLPPLASPEVAFMGCAMADCPKDYLAASSPITWVDPKDPPFLIQHGGKDATVNLRQAQRLTDALKAAGVPVELVVYPNQDHSFANPTGPRRNDSINQQALDKVYAFLERTLGSR